MATLTTRKFLLLVSISSLLLAPAANGQGNAEEKLASYSIPSVFQVMVGVNAKYEYSQYDVLPGGTDPFPYYEGANGYLVSYIKSNIEGGATLRSIENNLLGSGWQRNDIGAALKIARNPSSYSPQKKTFTYRHILLSGSAFIVNENGYLITNAHVVKLTDDDKSQIASGVIADIVRSTAQDVEYARGLASSDQISSFEYNLQGYFSKNGRLVSFEPEYFVVPPSLKSFSYDDILEKGWPAEVKEAGEKYPGKDIAVLKIDQGHLPALDIAEGLPSVGEKVFAIGFPAAANLTRQVENEATLTSGVVSAIRDSDNKDFQVIQTDVSIGGGSSGGPVLNQEGKVIGVVTLGGGGSFASGNFNYFLPVSLAADYLKQLNVYGNSSRQVTNEYRRAVDLLSQKDCGGAKAEIDSLQQYFQSNYIKALIGNCYLNAPAGENAKVLGISGKYIYFVLAGVFLLGFVGGGTAMFFYRRQKTAASASLPPSEITAV